jgi:pimeloyl-ACP methyl ester carboxylesterase
MKTYFVKNKEVSLHIVEEGEGPAILLLHGWPEFYYSWKYQIDFFVKAGYRVIASDVRGFGESDAPLDVEAYSIDLLTSDVVAILDSLNIDKTFIVGHDWGAVIAWQTVLRYPARFNAIVALSVPYEGEPTFLPLEQLKSTYGDSFHYRLYFQKPGLVEEEIENDIESFFLKAFAGGVKKKEPLVTDRFYKAGNYVDRIGYPQEEIPWFKGEDIDKYVKTYQKSGFRGGLNLYRNYDYNNRLNEHIDRHITIPVFYASGEFDLVIKDRDFMQLKKNMQKYIEDLRVFKIYPCTYHWIHKERYQEVNEDMLHFLKEVVDR